MKQYLEHNGYCGSIEVSFNDKCLYGRIEFINDLVSYEGNTFEELETSFKEAVEDYLATCTAQSKDPDRPFSGTFNVRIGPELHKKAAFEAKRADQSLNDYIKQAIDYYIDRPSQAPSQHFHFYSSSEQIKPFKLGRGESLWSQHVQQR